MKHKLLYIIPLFLIACQSDLDWTSQEASMKETITTTRHTATISVTWGKQVRSMTTSVSILLSEHENLQDYKTISLHTVDDSTWTVKLVDLKENQTYYIQYDLQPSYLWKQDGKSSFQVVNHLAPTAKTKDVSDITATSAKLYGECSLEDNYDITERGFYYSLLKDMGLESKKVTCGKGEGDFSAAISELRANATYYYVAYAINQNGIAFGDTLQFKTLNPY